jgi:hypothetical protein
MNFTRINLFPLFTTLFYLLVHIIIYMFISIVYFTIITLMIDSFQKPEILIYWLLQFSRVNLLILFYLVFGNTGDWTQDLVLVQEFAHFSHKLSLFTFSFLDMVSYFCLHSPQTSILLIGSSKQLGVLKCITLPGLPLCIYHTEHRDLQYIYIVKWIILDK